MSPYISILSLSLSTNCWYTDSPKVHELILSCHLFSVILSNLTSSLLVQLFFTGNHKMLEEKILSIPEHITNQHTFPNNNQHKQCSHPIPIVGGRDKKWLRPDSLVGVCFFVSLVSKLTIHDCRLWRKLEMLYLAMTSVGSENCNICLDLLTPG